MRSARVHCQPLIFLIATFLLLVPVSGNTLPQSIASGDGYKNLDPCAQSCVAGRDGPCDSGPIEAAIGCNMDCNDWGRNDCFCRGDKQSIATSFLSSCISVACTLGNPAIDISSGAGLYTDYCLSNGYALVPGATLTPATFPAATAVKPTDTTPPNGAAATTVSSSSSPYSITSTPPDLTSDTISESPSTITHFLTSTFKDTISPQSDFIPTTASNDNGIGHTSNSGLTSDGKAGLGAGLAIGVPSLIGTTVAAYYAWKATKRKKQRETARRSAYGENEETQ